MATTVSQPVKKKSSSPTKLSAGVYRIEVFGAGKAPNPGDAARLHSETLPRSPLSKLGASFMRRFYYDVLPKQGFIFGAVAYVGDNPAGFVAATYDSRGLVQHVLRHNFFRLLWVVGTTPPTYGRIEGCLEAWHVYRTRARAAKRKKPAPYGEVLSFGVREPFATSEFIANTGIDIKRDLMAGVMDGFRRSNLDKVRLIVERHDVEGRGFFQMLGFKVNRQAVPGWFTPSAELIWNPKDQ